MAISSAAIPGGALRRHVRKGGLVMPSVIGAVAWSDRPQSWRDMADVLEQVPRAGAARFAGPTSAPGPRKSQHAVPTSPERTFRPWCELQGCCLAGASGAGQQARERRGAFAGGRLTWVPRARPPREVWLSEAASRPSSVTRWPPKWARRMRRRNLTSPPSIEDAKPAGTILLVPAVNTTTRQDSDSELLRQSRRA